MKVLLVIPHVFSPKSGSLYSSQSEEKRLIKEKALGETTLGNLARHGKDCWIHASLGKGGQIVTREQKIDQKIELTIQLYTPKKSSLSSKIEKDARLEVIDPEIENLMHVPLAAAQNALYQAGNYDLIGYMEDDLAILDRDFFQKIAWLTKTNDPRYVFLPHRCEYIKGRGDVILSGDPDGGREDLFWDTGEELKIKWPLGDISFYRATNPHSGCWFLSQEQALMLIKYWKGQNWRPSFQLSGPLEQAGSGILLPLFKVMKPRPKDYKFLMISHQDALWKRHALEDGTMVEER